MQSKAEPMQKSQQIESYASSQRAGVTCINERCKQQREGLDSKQQIQSKLKASSRSEGEQLVAIDEEGKLFSVDDDGKLQYVATLDAPAIATVIDAGKRREL